MGLYKSIREKLRAKKEELEKEAAKRALAKIADTAKKRGASAVESAGKKIEEMLFGDSEPAPPSEEPKEKPDPFRDLKRREKEAKAAPPKAPSQADVEGEVDRELSALKKKLGK
jgi:hypothetical protein